jgi:hypothetical protein
MDLPDVDREVNGTEIKRAFLFACHTEPGVSGLRPLACGNIERLNSLLGFSPEGSGKSGKI